MNILHNVFINIKKDFKHTIKSFFMVYNINDTYESDRNEYLRYRIYKYTSKQFNLSEYNIFNFIENSYQYFSPILRTCIYTLIIICVIKGIFAL